jgi:hypothetical protein
MAYIALRSSLVLSALVACGAVSAQFATPQGPLSCTYVIGAMSLDEAKERFASVLRRSEGLAAEVRSLNAEKIPDDDPRSLRAGTLLGAGVVQMVQLCRCNEKLSVTEECLAFESSMQQHFPGHRQ